MPDGDPGPGFDEQALVPKKPTTSISGGILLMHYSFSNLLLQTVIEGETSSES